MTALYTFAVIDSGTLPTRLETDGVGIVREGAVAAVVEPVDVAEFEGERLERNLSDRSWLERAVRHHEHVVESLIDHTAVVPMRFGSIFSQEEGLRAMLADNASRFCDLLDLVRGRDEWGVRARVDVATLTRTLAPAAGVATSGGDYLRRRRAELQAETQLATAATDIASALHEHLAGVAERATLLQPRQADQHTVAVGAYLVPRADRARFLAAVTAFETRHEALQLEVTGPWPAYSFTSADVGGPRD